jgi:hypothetical protein
MACTLNPRGLRFFSSGKGERRSLAAAGLGLRDQIVPGQRDRQAGGLDRRHGVVAELFQIRQHGGRQRQLVEGSCACSGWSGCAGGLFSHAEL